MSFFSFLGRERGLVSLGRFLGGLVSLGGLREVFRGFREVFGG